MVRLTFLSMIDILLVHDSGVHSLKPWKLKRPFQMHCWKAIDNHVQGVIDITLGKFFQGFKRIRNGLLQSSSTFLSIVFCSYTHWSCMDGTTSGLTSKKVSTPLRMCKYLHLSKYAHKYLRSHQQRGKFLLLGSSSQVGPKCSKWPGWVKEFNQTCYLKISGPMKRQVDPHWELKKCCVDLKTHSKCSN